MKFSFYREIGGLKACILIQKWLPANVFLEAFQNFRNVVSRTVVDVTSFCVPVYFTQVDSFIAATERPSRYFWRLILLQNFVMLVFYIIFAGACSDIHFKFFVKFQIISEHPVLIKYVFWTPKIEKQNLLDSVSILIFNVIHILWFIIYVHQTKSKQQAIFIHRRRCLKVINL